MPRFIILSQRNFAPGTIGCPDESWRPVQGLEFDSRAAALDWVEQQKCRPYKPGRGELGRPRYRALNKRTDWAKLLDR